MISLHATKLLLYFSFANLIYIVVYPNRVLVNSRLVISPESMEKHQRIVNNYYDARKNWVTSNLGEYLFKNTNGTEPDSNVDIQGGIEERSFFNVLIWRHWPWLRGRLTRASGQKVYDPLSDCSVTNCKFIRDDDPDDVKLADAVVVHLEHGLLPDFKRRDPDQLWIFWSDESPNNTFSQLDKPRTFEQLANLFNWSMTHRSDSDIPIPYGRTLPLPYPKLDDVTDEGLKELVPFWKEKRRDFLAVNVMSRCRKFRPKFLKRLQKFISIDTFRGCAALETNKRRCPGVFMVDCPDPDIAKYLFYVVIEDANCRQYITEKVFHNSYAKGAIPIIAGVPLEDCIKLLPPNSFLHVESFSSLKALSKEVYLISNDITRLLSYHAWRNNFKIVEERGFFGTRSFPLCRICEGLNYNDRQRKQYDIDDIRLYLDPSICCKNSAKFNNKTLKLLPRNGPTSA